jgi:hypothetical protein
VTVISVIGPDARAVEQVTAGVGTATARRGRRFAAGAGPGEADGVVAVVTSSTVTAEDREVVRAVRDAMGVVVVYGPDGDTFPAEAGVVHCVWGDDGYAGQRSLAGLAEVVDGMWVDRERWVADARRADADRLDRVRIAVRLAAERIATELLDTGTGGTAGTAGTAGAEELDRMFRAQLTVAVLEQGVEMPNLAPAERTGEEEDTSAPSGGTAPHLVTAAAALGAGGAAAAGVVRLTDSPVAAVAAGVLVMTATAVARWWTGRAARREQAAARRAASLRRRWAATVTDVVARIVVPPVAERLPGGVS